MNYKIVTETEETESRYQNTPVMILENLPFYQKKVLDMCEYYANSKYLLGNKDELNREKPFYNVVNFRVTLAKVATDLDTKDVNITGDTPKDWVRSMLLQHESYEWMKEADFSYFLNKAGYTRAKYGGVLVKKCMEEGELEVEVVDWRNVVTDQIDILGGNIIETHYMTPVELMEKDGTWSDVREAIKESTKKQGQSSAYGQEEYNSERIEVKEVHGQFPISFMKEWDGEDISDEDDYIFKPMVFFYSKIGGTCFYFYADYEKELPYKYLPWEEMPGRALGRGVIEDSEEAQIWINDSVINEKNAMDLAGKVVLKTNSKKLGNNILEVDNGKIFELEDGKDINSMNLTPAALGQFQNQIDKWIQQADRATSSFDANTGEQPPAGTPYSQTALLNQVASKPFDYRREEMGIFVSEIFEDWVIPYLIKKLYKKHILASDYSDDELEVIDNSFAVKNSNKALVKQLLSMDMSQPMPTGEDQMAMIEQEKSKLSGVKRHIEIPEGYFDDFETKVTVTTTNEAKDKAAILQSLNTIMSTAMSSYNPQTGTFAVLENPTMAKIFGTIVETASAGLSPISLGIGKSQKSVSMPTPQPQAPVAPPVA